MDIKTLQNMLKLRGAPASLIIDGIAGRQTMDAIDNVLSHDAHAPASWNNWSDSRRRTAFEQIVMRDVGIEVGNIDGLVGPQMTFARTVWEARRNNGGKPVAEVEKWRDKPDTLPVAGATAVHQKWPRQRDVPSFYGAPGDASKQVMLDLPFPMRIAWDPEKTVHRFSCHVKCKDAFFNIWKNALDHYGYEAIQKLRLDMYGGTLNVRKMRGGSNWSMHSWGIAEDVDPERNQLKFKRATATLDDAPYEAFWKIVYAEGGLGLGRERDYDWMHFQFTSDFS